MPTQRSKLDDMTGNTAASTVDTDEGYLPTGGSMQPTYNTEADFKPDELSVTRLSIAQSLTPDVKNRVANEGQLLVTGMPPVDSAILVLAGHTPQRRFVEPGAMQARCYSVDGVIGIGDPGTIELANLANLANVDPAATTRGADGLMHLKCAHCPFSQWTDTGKKDPTGRTINARPACDELDSFVAYSITHGTPVLWNLKGTSAQVARFLKTLAKGLGFGNFAIEVTSETRTKGANSWKVPKVVLVNEGISADECRAYAAIALQMVQSTGQLPAQAEA